MKKEFSNKANKPSYQDMWAKEPDRWTPSNEDLACELQLSALGDWFPLDFKIDEGLYYKNVEYFKEKDWFQLFQPKKNIVNDRYSVMLYGLEGDSPTVETGLAHVEARLGDKPEEDFFKHQTEAGSAMTSMHEVFDYFDLGRTFFLRLNSAGHFVRHRDHIHLTRSTFRLIAFLGKDTQDYLHWEVDGVPRVVTPNRVYYVDTRKMHRVNASSHDIDMVVLNVKKDWLNVQRMMSRLMDW